jgi:hypothetical protein
VLFNPSTNADDDDDDDDGSADALEIMDEFDLVVAVVVPPRGRTPEVVDVANKFLLLLLLDADNDDTTALLLVDVDSEDSSSSDSRNNNNAVALEWTIMLCGGAEEGPSGTRHRSPPTTIPMTRWHAQSPMVRRATSVSERRATTRGSRSYAIAPVVAIPDLPTCHV